MSDPPQPFAKIAERAFNDGLASFDIDWLPSGWVGVPFFEQWNGRWLTEVTSVWSALERGWTRLIPDEHTIDISLALSVLADSCAYLNWYTEAAVLLGSPTAIEGITHTSPTYLFAESCANTFGQITGLLDRHADAPKIYENFGRLFEHPFRV